jgi:hypothetical protein
MRLLVSSSGWLVEQKRAMMVALLFYAYCMYRHPFFAEDRKEGA